MAVDIAQWRVFLSAADRGSLIQAAEVLHTDQPALSRSLKRLELLLGAPLFVRTSRGLTLTDFGRRMLEPVRELVARADAIEARARAELRRANGALLVGTVDLYPLTAVIADACRDLMAGGEDITTELVSVPWVASPRAVQTRAIDVGFALIVDGRLPDPSSMRCEPLWNETETFALISDRHPLANADLIDPRELADLPLHLPDKDESPDIYHLILEQLADAGVPAPRRAPAVGSFANVISQIASGSGWSMSAGTLARHPPPGTAVRPLATTPRRSVQFAVVWHVDLDRATIEAFVQHVRTSSASYSG